MDRALNWLMCFLGDQSAEKLREQLEAQTHALEVLKQEMSAAEELRAQELQDTIARCSLKRLQQMFCAFLQTLSVHFLVQNLPTEFAVARATTQSKTIYANSAETFQTFQSFSELWRAWQVSRAGGGLGVGGDLAAGGSDNQRAIAGARGAAGVPEGAGDSAVRRPCNILSMHRDHHHCMIMTALGGPTISDRAT